MNIECNRESFIPCPHSYLHFHLLSKISGGPWGGPWTGSTEVVHGLGPWGGPCTGSTGVVHRPGSMFCIRPTADAFCIHFSSFIETLGLL